MSTAGGAARAPSGSPSSLSVPTGVHLCRGEPARLREGAARCRSPARPLPAAGASAGTGLRVPPVARGAGRAGAGCGAGREAAPSPCSPGPRAASAAGSSPCRGRWCPGSSGAGAASAGPPGLVLRSWQELWGTGCPLCAALGCLSCHRASLVLASSSAYKRFSALLPKEERVNVCSARIPKSQILTLPELRVRCRARRTRYCSLCLGVFGQGPVYLPRCSALDVTFTYRTAAVPTNSFRVLAVPWRIPEIPTARGGTGQGRSHCV